jgi:CheY-like chemotaxis protein
MPYHILVVDDNEMNLTLIAKILEMDGYQVTLASSGKEAVRLVIQQMPDLAIVDVLMPDMDGFELCQKMRQAPLNVKGPIVLLTAMTSEYEKHHAMKAGANDIWSKPFDLELFRRRTGELLNANLSS